MNGVTATPSRPRRPKDAPSSLGARSPREVLRPPSRGDDAGSAAAELAVALPVVVLILMLGVGIAGVGMRQVALQDTASDAARLLGRGEGEGAAGATVRRGEPGADMSIRRESGLVCVFIRSEAVLAGQFALPLRAEACALDGGR